MSELQKSLMRQVQQKYSIISPCSNKQSLESCFSREMDYLVFWYNTKDHSTHIEQVLIKNEQEAA